jgi:hypothetical protein
MKCAVVDCKKDASDLILFVGRFGAVQPHLGGWSAIWICKDHIEQLRKALETMKIVGCEASYEEVSQKLSGLPEIENDRVKDYDIADDLLVKKKIPGEMQSKAGN